MMIISSLSGCTGKNQLVGSDIHTEEKCKQSLLISLRRTQAMYAPSHPSTWPSCSN